MERNFFECYCSIGCQSNLTQGSAWVDQVVLSEIIPVRVSLRMVDKM